MAGGIQKTGSGRPLYAGGGYTYAADTSFVTGDSPVVVDVKGALGYTGADGWFSVDGAGDVQIAISTDGTNYGDTITLKGSTNTGANLGEMFNFLGMTVWKLKIIWVSNSAYRYMFT